MSYVTVHMCRYMEEGREGGKEDERRESAGRMRERGRKGGWDERKKRGRRERAGGREGRRRLSWVSIYNVCVHRVCVLGMSVV